jgi:hypothetical protein
MPKICYEHKNFRQDTLRMIALANSIIDQFAAQGYDLTLRQLYYQLVSRDVIPNTEKEYEKLGRTISDARMAGLVDWSAIVDRTRNLRSNSHFNDPASIIDAAAQQYGIDKWASQPHRVEVWIEKDALVGVIAGVCSRLDVPYFSCRGYTSQSEMWAAAQRLRRWCNDGQTPVILHLGDHDPSGIDMTRDVDDRLQVFMGGATIERLALNWNQVEQYNPPPNPAKLTDTRADTYIARFGVSSWELDALDPNVIGGLIASSIEQFRDPHLWAAAEAQENEGRELLSQASIRWDELARIVRHG